MFVLLSPGSLNSQERESCVELVCVGIFVQALLCVLPRERVLADVCILAGWTVFAFQSTSVHACTKGDASLCTHIVAFFIALCLSSAGEMSRLLRASLCPPA